ncbi:uncharacterized protein LOC129766810 [Toxorhynchites rutilus septentrionalis]|uniref:uncharacterized protein LOC129766810 n=1 Tax=Toxorhynchites rutilus septentrionalis TaxID=329112 RepID=UPI00247AF0EF|nr:uncharacterized protein LOC129766810 [Toxorhynchites rutilus septentrionalis]
MENSIIENVQHRRANSNTKYHCLYGYYFLELSRSQLSTIYKKSKSTQGSWIVEYEREGIITRSKRQSTFRKIYVDKRTWLINLYQKNPILYLDEARQQFIMHFGVSISASSICKILHDAYGMTWKVDIERYVNELSCFQWDLHQLLFLDKVAFANTEIMRNRGYGIIGQKLMFRGEFCRKPRIPCLCFLGQAGIVESFETEGTFTRQKSYPVKFSVWVMDGARIHCDANIIQYLRSLGIIPLFLPAYCPFYNPIEVVFGLIKRYLKRNFKEIDNMPLSSAVQAGLIKFTLYNCTELFSKCGYASGGKFNSSVMYQ